MAAAATSRSLDGRRAVSEYPSCLVSSVQDRSAAQLLYEEEIQLDVVIEFAKDLIERCFLGVKRPSGCLADCTLIMSVLESLT